LELADDLPFEVRVIKAEHEQLHRSHGHVESSVAVVRAEIMSAETSAIITRFG
jgi:hypothetical protein